MRGGRGKGALGGRRAAAPGSAYTLERGCGPSSPSAPGVRAPGGGAREPRAQEEEGGRLLGGPGKERAAGGIPNPLLPSLPPSARPHLASLAFLFFSAFLAPRKGVLLPLSWGALLGHFPDCRSRRGSCPALGGLRRGGGLRVPGFFWRLRS